MKKLFALMLALMLALSLSACGENVVDTANSPEVSTGDDRPSGENPPAGDSGKRLTPIMGWASWNLYRATIDEQKLTEQMNALVSTGLAEAGYTYFNIDDGFFGGRADDGTLLLHPEKFKNGMKMFADMAHEKGLYAGIYTDAGQDTCASMWDRGDVGEYGDGVGLYGYEEQDLRTYLVDWGFDFIKIDWCGGDRLGLDEQTQYTKIGGIIEEIRQETGKYKVFNVCRWQFPGEWVVDVADSWRVGGDIREEFSSIMYQIDQVAGLAQYHGPGHVNDLDMMQIGNGMNYEEDKTHFSMWCMMSTPLMLGNDLTAISDETLEIVTNKELIALNQDPACLQATLAVDTDDGGEIWVKDLGAEGSSTKAVALLNRSRNPLEMTCNFSDLGFSGYVTVRDLWAHEDMDVGDSYSVSVPAHGIVVLKVSGGEGSVNINADSAKDKVKHGAVLMDVRSAREYDESHIDGAINIEYTDILEQAEGSLPDKETEIIVYCAAGKRSAQSLNFLNYLGYEHVYNLGGMSNWYG